MCLQERVFRSSEVCKDLCFSLQFADQFKEIREAARMAREKSQEKFELTNPGLNIAAPQVNSTTLHATTHLILPVTQRERIKQI